VNVESSCAELMKMEKHFLALWKTNPHPDIYSSFLTPHARMQREGHFPTTHPDTINAWISQLHKTLTWEPVGSGVASSGDLGFTYGLFEMPDNPNGTKEHYVRIWKKQQMGKWMIALEMMSID